MRTESQRGGIRPIHTSLAIVTFLEVAGYLCLGIWIGWKIGKSQAQRLQARTQPGQSAGAADLPDAADDSCLAAVADLDGRVRQISSAWGQARGPLTDSLRAAVGRLVEATAALHRQIVGSGTAACSDAAPAAVPRSAAAAALQKPGGEGHEHRAALTAAELQELARHDAVDDEAATHQRRFAYSTRQYVAPWIEGRIPESADFQPVLCHDLSVGGISFFAEQQLSDHVVVVLDGPKFILCRVCHTRPTFADGEHRYLIGCQFVRRLPAEQFDLSHLSGAAELAPVECR